MSAFSNIPLGSVIPVFFDSFAGATGASITITGLAITDIEIFKGTSMTQRASDAGYVLLDTDGIDLDGITGIQGFSIDTGDNTDAGFYAAGSFYNVVVSAITVDSQTVNFVAHRFRLVAAEGTAGTPVADATRWNNLATVALPLIPTTAGRTLDVSATGEAGVDWANVGSPTTSLALTGTTIAVTQKVDVETIKTNPVANGGTFTFPTNATGASTTNITAGTITTTTNVTTVNGLAANVITAAATAADFSTEVNTSVLAILGTPAGASMSADIAAIEAQTDDIGAAGAGLTALASAADLATVAGYLDTEIAAIKAQTDKLTFDASNYVLVDLRRIRDIALVGDGSGTPFNV